MPKIPLILGDYRARSIIASAQRCINLFGEPNPKDAETPFTFYPTPGLKLLGQANPGSAGGSPAGGGPPNQGGGGSGGGGVVPPPVPPPSYVPVLPQFTIHNNSGGNASDTPSGLAVFSPQVGHGNAGAMVLSQNAPYPGDNFTITIGFTSDLSWTGTGGGASQVCGVMIYFRDPISGIFVGFGPSLRVGQVYPEANVCYAEGLGYGLGAPFLGSFVSNVNPYPQFIQIVASGAYGAGGTFTVNYGPNLTSLSLAGVKAKNDILPHAPTEMGLWVIDSDGGNMGINATFYYYRIT